MRRLLALVASVAPFLPGSGVDARAQAPGAGVPEPAAYLAAPPGTDRALSDWSELTAYYERLSRASDRVTLDTLGVTPEGRPLVLLTVTSVANHARLDELIEVQGKLADPRTISGPTERARLLERGRGVVLITHGVHATEVGSAEMAPRLLHRLATADDSETRRILDELVVLDIPSLNPDGLDRVVRWYRSTLGTPDEGAPLPWPDHPLVGHDLNRDWYAFTQPETEAVVRGVYHRWRPQVVHDIHQMGPYGARLFVPPYADPWEPNVDPAVIAAVNAAGSAVAARMLALGHEGVVTAALFDAYSPGRAYAHHHGAARILSETASARLASPVEIEAHDLVGFDDFDPLRSTWNHPRPWSGGRWGMPEIVSTMHDAALALLGQVARSRRVWLEMSLGVAERAVAGRPEWPAAWLVAPHPDHPERLARLARALALGQVEVARTLDPVSSEGRRWPAGSLVVSMRQPYASFAQALFERQEYPDLRRRPDEPPRVPYDATAHSYALMLGLEPVASASAPPARTEPVHLRELPLEATFDRPERLVAADAPRLGLYLPRSPDPAAGWARWLLERHGVPHDTLRAEHLRSGRARDLDVLLLDAGEASTVTGELADAEVRALSEFVRGGGRLVAVQGAAAAAIDLLGLPVTNAVDRLPAERFFIPGSIVAVAPDTAAEPIPAWFDIGSMAFDTADPTIEVLARYGPLPLLSGWATGADLIADRPAVVRVPVGAGQVVLFGFPPNYRGQSAATWPMLFDLLSGR